MTEHPITPPPELVKKWMRVNNMDIAPLHLAQALATQAALWGSDQELKACCEWAAEQDRDFDLELRAARRPQAPSLAEEALAALNEIEDRYAGPSTQEILVRRALERLQELENNG